MPAQTVELATRFAVLWHTHPWWGRKGGMMAGRQKPFATLLRTGRRHLFVLSLQRRFATSGRPPG